MKKKLLITFLTVALFSSVFSIVTLAEAVPVEVRAAESWTNATYDPENNILTNIVIDDDLMTIQLTVILYMGAWL